MTGKIDLWRSVLLLFVSGLAASVPVAAIAPALSGMAAALGPGEDGVVLAQTVMTVPGLAMLLTGPLIGWGSERIGYRYMLLAGLAGFTVFGVGGFFICSGTLLIISRFLLGVAAIAVLTPTFALVSYYFEGHARERLLGLMAGAAAAAGISTALLAAYLVQELDWRWPFLLFGFAAPLYAACLPIITDRDGQRTPIKPAPAAPGETAPLMALAGIYALGMWMALLSFNVAVQVPFLMAERGFDNPIHVSVVISVVSISMIVISPLYGRLASNLRVSILFAIILGLFSIGHAIIGSMEALMITFIGSAFFGFASMFIQPVTASYIFSRFPESTHGRAMGGLIGCLFLGQFLNPFVLGPITALVGMGSMFIVLAWVSLIGALIALAAPLYLRRMPTKS